MGYRHLSRTPIYFRDGRFYHVPDGEGEAGSFNVDPVQSTAAHPSGGHNYYNGRDMERTLRRLQWLVKADTDNEKWEERYLESLRSHAAQFL